jgi:DhnA family fructose-bisphosphate aldolase class Ia
MMENGIPGFLDGKLMLASLNRGGLHGVSWEMNDPLTGASPEYADALSFDGVKLLWRVCDDDAGSLETMKYCVSAINEASRLKLPIFFEPLPVVQENGSYKLIKNADALVPLVGAASALGDSSRYLWLKLPYCPDFGRVAKSTTLPIVMLGGESGNTDDFLAEMKDGMSAHHNVRGTMIGRNVMYPAIDDPVEVALAVQKLVHPDASQKTPFAGD